MKYIIFGTGKYYEDVKQFINMDEVLCFMDNSPQKQGQILDGKRICMPEEVDFSEAEFVLVLVMRYEVIKNQLIGLGVSQSKIHYYFEMSELFDIELQYVHDGALYSLSQWDFNESKNVLMMVHEMTRNGVSVVFMQTALLLKKMGYNVLFCSLISGELISDLEQNGISYISHSEILYKSNNFNQFVKRMDYIFLGTVGTAYVADAFKNFGIPIIWWMHESNDKNFEDFKIYESPYIRYYAGGKRVSDKFLQYYPNRTINQLLYFLPDETMQVKEKHNKIRFAIIGFICKRKAQDIFIEAIRKLPKNKRRDAEFYFVGKKVENIIDIDLIQDEINEIKYIEELSQKDLKRFFETIDVLVCPSRDDPMPVVVTQAMQHKVPCIVSTEVGQSVYIKDGVDGFVFESENVVQLHDAISTCITNKNKLVNVGEKGNSIFETHFSERSMEKNLKKIMSDFNRNGI